MHSQIDIKIIEARKARLIRRKVLVEGDLNC
jgi:hypothetical protein